MKKSLALLGFGALSHIFLKVCHEKLTDSYELCGIYTHHAPADPEGYRFFDSMEALLSEKPDFVLEFAGIEAVRTYGETILRSGSHLVLVSIGALADDDLYHCLTKAAADTGCKLYLTSGAVGGFDILRTMSMIGTDQILIENRKAPAGLNGAPCLNGIDLPEDKETPVFQGSAREAIAAFPKNVNVAVASALAASDADHAQVAITSVPGLKKNTHIIQAENALADIRLEISSNPDPANPRSSTITAWSAAALLKNLASPVEFF